MNQFENGGTRGYHLELAFKYLIYIYIYKNRKIKSNKAELSLCKFILSYMLHLMRKAWI